MTLADSVVPLVTAAVIVLAIIVASLVIALGLAVRAEDRRRMTETVRVVDGAVVRPARVWLQRVVGPVILARGEAPPWWVGMAYWRWDANERVCFLVPLNWLVMAAHQAWFHWRRLCWRAPAQRFTHEALRAAAEQGYQLGQKEGFDLGRRLCAEGHEELRRRAVSDFTALLRAVSDEARGN